MTKKIKVAVLYGGNSGEHEISILSAASIIGSLDRDRYDVIPVGIDKQGCWYLNKLDDVFSRQNTELQLKAASSQSMLIPQFFADKDQAFDVDIYFPVAHGPLYEDGVLQGVLQSAATAYVGTPVLGSAITMDKDVSKRILAAAGIPVTLHVAFNRGQWQERNKTYLQRMKKILDFPMFVKPANLGSSVGIAKVENEETLKDAIEVAFRCDNKVIVEQGVNACDVELSVLQNSEYGKEPLVSLPSEIELSDQHDFYSYESKYTDPHGAKLIIPADLPQDLIKKLQDHAKHAFEVLECEAMARVDFLVDKSNNTIYLNELNTIPGFTNISAYPKMWEASGIPYPELLTNLIDLGLARHQREKAIIRDYSAL